jgi:uncharacterized protein YpbB
VTVTTKSRYLINPKMESLEDYVGSRSSTEIIQNLKRMDPKEIAELKDSLETIFRSISVDKIYH